MFMRKFNGFLMNAESEISGGGSGEVKNQASGDTNSKPVVENGKRDFEAELNALKNKNNELITELRTIKAKQSEKHIEDLKQKQDFEKLYQIEAESKKELAEKYQSLENQVKEVELKAARTQQFDALKKELGCDAYDWELVKEKVNWDKFVEDKNSTYGYNEEGLKQEVERLRKDLHFFFKPSPVNVPQPAAKGTEQKSSPENRWKKSGLL